VPLLLRAVALDPACARARAMLALALKARGRRAEGVRLHPFQRPLSGM